MNNKTDSCDSCLDGNLKIKSEWIYSFKALATDEVTQLTGSIQLYQKAITYPYTIF